MTPAVRPPAYNGIPVAAARGTAYGLAAGLLLGLTDTALSARALLSEFDDALTWSPLVLRQLLLPLGPGCLLGCGLALLLRGLDSLSQRQAQGRAGRADRWLGNYLVVLALPGLLWLVLQLFSGPRAQRLPGRPLLSIALVLLGGLLVRALSAGLARLSTEAPRRLLSLAPLFGLGALAALLADRLVLPRLYPWFHQGLQLGAFLSALTAAWAIDRGRRTQRSAESATSPLRHRGLFSIALITLCCGLSLWALGRLYRASLLRSYVLEHTTIAAALMRPYAAERAKSAAATSATPMGAIAPLHEELQPAPPVPLGPRLSGRDVFLITVDALRHDRLALLPTVRELAARGVVFDRAYTQVPHTSFALATLLTGKPVYALVTLGQDAASHETLPTVLRRFRYKTAAFYPPSVFYIEHDKLKSLEDSAYGFEYVKYEYLNGAARTDQVLAFLETEKPERAFVWVHYLEPHEPYEPHPDLPAGQATTEKDSDSRRYDGEIAYVDRELHRLVSYLQTHRPGALVLFSADHGEEFSEHGGRYHGTTLYQEQVHVPLLLAPVLAPTAPAATDGGAEPGLSTTRLLALLAENASLLSPQRVTVPVGLIDMAPTLLGLLDIERSARMRGRDLSPWLLTGAPPSPGGPVFAEIGRKKMVVLGADKLICDLSTEACQLFNLEVDPGEHHNLIGEEPALLARLRGLLDRSLAESRRFEQGGAAPLPAGAAGTSPSPATATPTAPSPAIDAQSLSRARLGDRTVLPTLFSRLRDHQLSPEGRRSLLSLIGPLVATLPPPSQVGAVDPLAPLATPENLAILTQALAQAQAQAGADRETERWAAVSLLRLSAPTGTAPSEPALAAVRALLFDASVDAEARLCAALALAAVPSCRPGPKPTTPPKTPGTDCLALWIESRVLPAALALQDADRVRPLIDLFSRTRDPRATQAVLSQLENVLSRADLVRALGTLGQVTAVPALVERLQTDPYVHVRAAAATALGQLAPASKPARDALNQATRQEREPAVLTAIQTALPPSPPPKK